MRALSWTAAAGVAVLALAAEAGGAGAQAIRPGQGQLQGMALEQQSGRLLDFQPQSGAEQQAFAAARAVRDPAARAAAFERFLRDFPASAGRKSAMLQVVIAWAETQDAARLQAAADRALAAFPDDVTVHWVVVDAERRAAELAGDPALGDRLAGSAAADATRGLALLPGWRRPPGLTPTQFAATKTRAEAIFEQALGYAAFRDKDYAAARTHLGRAAALRGDDWPTLEQLAAADLIGPSVQPLGFWYAAKAAALARGEKNAAAAEAIDRFAQTAYRSYHGGDDGWAAIAAAAASQSAPPQGFSVSHQPSPAELAVQAVEQHGAAGLGFGDWEAVLSFRDASPENRAAADKVWAAIQALQKNGAVSLKLPAKVVAATATTVDAAVGEDSRASGGADVHAALAEPMSTPLRPGQEIELSGVLDGYTPVPFSFHMTRARAEPK